MGYTLKPGEKAPIFAAPGATLPVNSVEFDTLFKAWGEERIAQYTALVEREREERRKQGEKWQADEHGYWAWRKIEP